MDLNFENMVQIFDPTKYYTLYYNIWKFYKIDKNKIKEKMRQK
jgi:hypothetical protein